MDNSLADNIFATLAWTAIALTMVGIGIALLIKKPRRPRRWAVLLWLLIPQLVVFILLWLALGFYGVRSSFYLFSAPLTMAAMLLFVVIPSSQRSMLRAVLCGHLAGAVLFWGLSTHVEPSMFRNLNSEWASVQLRDLDEANPLFLLLLNYADYRQRMLSEAVINRMIPETTIKALLEQGADPFEQSEMESAFRVAIMINRLPSVRLFSEQLVGDSERAVRNRRQLLADNPLSDMRFSTDIGPSLGLDSGSPFEHSVAQYDMPLGQILLAKMPELASDDLYGHFLQNGDKASVAFLWQYRKPQKPIYQCQALTLMGKTSDCEEKAASE